MEEFVALTVRLKKLNDERTELEREIKIAFDIAVMKMDPADAHRKHALPLRHRGPGRRFGSRMSAEARAKISAAQKRRWAKQKAAGK